MSAEYSDEWIRHRVLASLLDDARLTDPGGIAVGVHHGAVRLEGTVPSTFEKVLAERDAAEIPGVQRVQNELAVTPPGPGTDAELVSRIRDNLTRDQRLTAPHRIAVTADHAVVTLSGTVPAAYQRVDAEDDAWPVPGVVDVINQLRVVSPDARADAVLAQRVFHALARNPALATAHLHVLVEGGTVFLSGTAPTFYAMHEAAAIAARVPGVHNLVNNVLVAT
jgi:osmotically-inducible protein OsmY